MFEFDIVAILQMTALQLDSNRLYSLRNMVDMVLKMPNITILNLAHNHVRYPSWRQECTTLFQLQSTSQFIAYAAI